MNAFTRWSVCTLLFLAFSTYAFADPPAGNATAPNPSEIVQCKAALKQYIINQFGSFTKENKKAIAKNCTRERSKWMCFLKKVNDLQKKEGVGPIDMATMGNFEGDCGISEPDGAPGGAPMLDQ